MDARLGLLYPARSVCLSCRVPIPWYDNLPVLSYLWLRGRCRRCGASIGLRTLLVEIATPLIALGIYAALDFGWLMAAGWLGASWMLVAMPMRWEGRRIPRWFWVLGGSIGLACLTGWLLQTGS